MNKKPSPSVNLIEAGIGGLWEKAKERVKKNKFKALIISFLTFVRDYSFQSLFTAKITLGIIGAAIVAVVYVGYNHKDSSIFNIEIFPVGTDPLTNDSFSVEEELFVNNTSDSNIPPKKPDTAQFYHPSENDDNRDSTQTIDASDINEKLAAMSITLANKAFAEQDYEKALKTYYTADSLSPQAFLKDKVAEIEIVIAKADKNKKMADFSIEAGNKAFIGKNYSKALRAYQLADSLYPQSFLKYRIIEIESILTEKIDVTVRTFTIKDISFKMILVNAGSFRRDQKKVVLSKDYWIAETEVTQDLFRAVMGKNPTYLSFKGCDRCPVENVSWNDAQEFIIKLNEKINENYITTHTTVQNEKKERKKRHNCLCKNH